MARRGRRARRRNAVFKIINENTDIYSDINAIINSYIWEQNPVINPKRWTRKQKALYKEYPDLKIRDERNDKISNLLKKYSDFPIAIQYSDTQVYEISVHHGFEKITVKPLEKLDNLEKVEKVIKKLTNYLKSIRS